MSYDYLTGYLPDSESRLKNERKKALRNVAIMAVVIAAFFYVLIKVMGILLRDNAKVHYSASGNTTVIVPDAAVPVVDANPVVEKTPVVDTETVVGTETEAPSSSVTAVDKTVEALEIPKESSKEQSSKQVVKIESAPESNQSTNPQIAPVSSDKEPTNAKNTDDSQKPIKLEDLEDVYNKQLSIIIEGN